MFSTFRMVGNRLAVHRQTRGSPTIQKSGRSASQKQMTALLLSLIIAITSILVLKAADDPKCLYNARVQTAQNNLPEIFWINMDKSANRRELMEQHLGSVGYMHRRVKGLSLSDVFFPEDVLSSWDKYLALTQTALPIPTRHQAAKLAAQKGRSHSNFTHIMVGLVGRGGKNKLKEIGCTSSHLEAIRQAVHHNRSSSRYAVIMEDDVHIPFNIDFAALAASAPKDFGILQLFNSNEGSMESQWNRYTQSKHLWADSFQNQAASFWSTCAYLIDRDVMRPIIDKIAYANKDWVNLKIVAGIKKPCRPKVSECCSFQNDTMTFKFSHIPPCVWASKGFQADSYIYALAKTYVLSVPLITNGAGGNVSTFHQDHVISIHQSAFARQRTYINQLISGQQPLPAFATKACTEPLDVNMVLKNATSAPPQKS